MRFRMMVSLLAFWMVATLLPTSASASDFRIRVEDRTNPNAPVGVVVTDWVSIADPHTGDADPAEGLISLSVNGLSNNVMFNLTLGYTKGAAPGFDPNAIAELYLTNVTMTTSGAADVRVTIEDTNYPGGHGLVLNTSLTDGLLDVPGLAAPAGSTMSTRSWANVGNTGPALGADSSLDSSFNPIPGPLTPIGPNAGASTPPLFFQVDAAGDPVSFTGATASVGFGDASTYALFTQVDLHFTDAGMVSFNQDTNVDPTEALKVAEPGSLMLFGVGLLGVVYSGRRRFSYSREI